MTEVVGSSQVVGKDLPVFLFIRYILKCKQTCKLEFTVTLRIIKNIQLLISVRTSYEHHRKCTDRMTSMHLTGQYNCTIPTYPVMDAIQ